MTNIKTLSAAIILCVTVATPVLAQDTDTLAPQPAPARHVRAHDQSSYRGAYNQSNAAEIATPRMDAEAFGFGRPEDADRYRQGN
jgi:hypothetical protein